MPIEALVTSVNYNDVLIKTLPRLIQEVDRAVVVTDNRDDRCVEICGIFGVECIRTDAFYNEDAPFRKAAAINDAWQKVGFRDWVLFTDADIVLPIGMKMLLPTLNDECIYGADRRIYQTRQDWEQNTPVSVTVNPPVIGYFQLFHSSKFHPLCERSEHAAKYDVSFRNRWPVENRLILSFKVDHLGLIRKNWRGRKSPQW